jgi:hypothetical protein
VKPSATLDNLECYGVLPGQYLEVTFVQGWSNPDLAPIALKQAVLAMAVNKYQLINPQLTTRKIGNTEEKYSIKTVQSSEDLPPEVITFLKGLIDPMMYAVV